MVNHRKQKRSRAGKTNLDLDDLDGALASMIGSEQEVKLVAPDERRYVLHSSNDQNDSGREAFANNESSLKSDDISGGNYTHTSNFEKHQVNYSATKYIKP